MDGAQKTVDMKDRQVSPVDRSGVGRKISKWEKIEACLERHLGGDGGMVPKLGDGSVTNASTRSFTKSDEEPLVWPLIVLA